MIRAEGLLASPSGFGSKVCRLIEFVETQVHMGEQRRQTHQKRMVLAQRPPEFEGRAQFASTRGGMELGGMAEGDAVDQTQSSRMAGPEHSAVELQGLGEALLDISPGLLGQARDREQVCLHELEGDGISFTKGTKACIESCSGERFGLGHVAAPPVSHGTAVEGAEGFGMVGTEALFVKMIGSLEVVNGLGVFAELDVDRSEGLTNGGLDQGR
jgi:hypothetical protein